MSYQVRIPDPCHEDWSKMTENEQGKFCAVCSKTVHDFTYKSDMEIHTILKENSNGKICGRFSANQINRPIQITDNRSFKVNYRSVFLAAVLLAFGTFLFSCKNKSGTNMKQDELNAITGVMMVEPPALLGEPAVVNQLDSPKVEFPEPSITGDIAIEDPIVDVDSVSELNIVDSVENPIYDYPVLGGAMYYHEIVEAEEPLNKVVEDNKEEIVGKKVLTVYPNPTSGSFTLEYKIGKETFCELSIFDLSGKMIKQIIPAMKQYSGIYQNKIDLTELPSGIYIARLVIGDKIETERIVISK